MNTSSKSSSSGKTNAAITGQQDRRSHSQVMPTLSAAEKAEATAKYIAGSKSMRKLDLPVTRTFIVGGSAGGESGMRLRTHQSNCDGGGANGKGAQPNVTQEEQVKAMSDASDAKQARVKADDAKWRSEKTAEYSAAAAFGKQQSDQTVAERKQQCNQTVSEVRAAQAAQSSRAASSAAFGASIQAKLDSKAASRADKTQVEPTPTLVR